MQKKHLTECLSEHSSLEKRLTLQSKDFIQTIAPYIQIKITELWGTCNRLTECDLLKEYFYPLQRILEVKEGRHQMNKERAKEIFHSEDMIHVMHEDREIYIEEVIERNEMARIHPMDQPNIVQKVPLYELKESETH